MSKAAEVEGGGVGGGEASRGEEKKRQKGGK